MLLEIDCNVRDESRQRILWPHSLAKALAALCVLGLMLSAFQSDAYVDSALTAKVHPNSPHACNISIVEIGPEIGDVWQPQLALLYDTQRGLARVRKVYGYFAHPSLSRPAQVLNVDSVDRGVGVYLVYQILRGIISSALITIGITTGVDRLAVEPYLTNSKVQERKAMEIARHYMEGSTFAVPDGLNIGLEDFRDEMKRLLLAGDNIFQYQKLFVDRTLAPKAWDWTAQTLTANANHNDTRLSFVLERLGQPGLQLEHWGDQFAVLKWHRDELLEVANVLDLAQLDVNGNSIPARPLTSEEKERVRYELNQLLAGADANGYVTVAVYDLMNSNKDKVKVVDGVSGPQNLARRKYVQFFHSVGLDFGGSLLALGPKIVMNVVDRGINLVFDKRGVMTLYGDLEGSEAELFAVLNSNLLDGTAATQERLHLEDAIDRQTINVFTRLEGEAHDNRAANEELMHTYLTEHGAQLCDEVNKARDEDFQNEYLTERERAGVGISRLNDPAQRAAIIDERLPAVNARRTLRLYDPTKFGGPKAREVREALTVLAVLRESQDVRLLGQVLDRTSDDNLMTAVLEAMAVHGDPAAADWIVDWLGTIGPRSQYGTSGVVAEALHTLTMLNWSAVAPGDEYRFVAVLEGVTPFAERGLGDSQALAVQVQANVREQLRYRQTRSRQSVQSP